ncbi:MAG: hypothetical protein IKI37_05395, partial [Oscillospiraceae bacterium]|nr:hypothetical protein [Oscillospiraceae bacterium]
MQERIAILNSVYEFGSTGSLAKQLFEYGCANGYEPYVFYGRGQRNSDEHIVKIDSDLEFYIHKAFTLLTGLQGYFSNIATGKLLRELKRLEIRKVIFLNLHGYYLNEKRLFKFCRDHKISIVYIMPDEYAGLGKCAYCNECTMFKNECGMCPQVKEYPKSLFFDQSRRIFRMKKKAYEKQDMVLVGPRANIQHLNGSSLLKKIKMLELDWGIDLDMYRFRENVELYDKYKIPEGKILVLTVAKYSMKRKGVADYFFGAARKLENSNIHFINVGYDGDLTEQDMP